jgi:hypothetical protein
MPLSSVPPSGGSALEAPLDTVVESIPHEAYFYKLNGRWCLDSPVGPHGITAHLVEAGLSVYEARDIVKNKQLRRVHHVDLFPAKYGDTMPDLVKLPDGKWALNIWDPPRLTPMQNPYPSIERLLSWLTGHDPQGVAWLKNWIAAKLQDPALVPKVAVLFAGAHGSGKDTFAKILMAMLGPGNCAKISRRNLENRFNARWVGKLFVFANEVVTKEHYTDIAEELKEYITSDTTEIEGKGQNQRRQTNRLSWVFASNDTISPLLVERGDRRYTIFANHTPLPPQPGASPEATEYADMIRALYLPNDEPTEAFMAEIAGFYYDTLHCSVDHRASSTPYHNEAREDLITASETPADSFFRDVQETGIDEYLEAAKQGALGLVDEATYDFGEKGLSRYAVHQAYVAYCKLHGGHSLKANRFGIAVKNHRPEWPSVRVYCAPTQRQVYCYQVPRCLTST